METHMLNYLLNTRRLMFSFLVFVASLIFAQSGFAQTTTVKGVVKDINGEPLTGVSISVKGTTLGTFTDIDGNYSLNIASDKAVVRFSFLGYIAKEEVVGKRTNINVTLQEDALNLEEVVVVGYGTQKKVNLTGSIASIKGDDALSRNTVSLSSALVGTMPGVTVQQGSGEPGADGASINIRGIGSLNAGQGPLILVDGLEVSINQVDPSTIETITTLKDAASASIYGSRAANGVILITTKRGKEGPVKVTYRATASSQRPTNMPQRVGAADFMEYTDIAAINNGGFPVYGADKIDEYRKYQPDNWTRFDTDWKDLIMKDQALLQDHTISVTGGSSTLKFMGVGKYVSQGGLIENNSYSRYSLRLNTDAQIYKWMRVAVDVNLLESKNIQPSINTPKSIINKALSFPSTLAGINADGTWGYGRNADNPIATASVGGTSVTRRPEMNLSGQVFITPITGLELMAQYSRADVVNRGRTLVTPWQHYNQGVYKGLSPLSGDKLTEGWNQSIRNLYIAQATYSKTIKGHSFKILGGFQAEDNTYTDISASKSGFEFPGYYFLKNGIGEASATGGQQDWAMASLYTRLNYVFKDRYLLEVNGRWDASSRFREGLRWSLFPSFSAGWIFSEEEFAKGISNIVPFGKLRVSYGSLGNQDVGAMYPGWAQVNPGYSYWFDKQLNPGVAITTASNEFITWEKSTQFNLGLDLAFLKNRLSVNADFYVKDVTDMIMDFPPPYFDGLKPPYTNAAKMRNTGWELSVSYKGSVNKFTYGASVIVDDARNKVLDLKGRIYTDNTFKVGYAAKGLWGYETNGYFQTLEEVLNEPYLATEKPGIGYVKYVDQDGSGSIDNDDRIYQGDPFPHFNYGVRLTGALKGFDFLVFIQGVGKRSVMLSGIGLEPFSNGSSMFAHQTDFWTEDNRNAEYPILLPSGKASNNFKSSDKWIRSGAYARLKTVEIGYTFPVALTKKLQIGSLRTFIGGQNLLTISNFYKGYDPEVSVGGDQGGEFYPIMRLFTFGLDIKF